MLHAGAFNWTYTLGTGLMDPWSIGATALIPGQDVTPDHLSALMKEYQATLFAAAPGVYRRLLRADVGALPHLRHGLSAGETMASSVRDDCPNVRHLSLRHPKLRHRRVRLDLSNRDVMLP